MKALCRFIRQPQWRSTNLPKFKIATFYSTDVELWFNQIETQLDFHQITEDGEVYRLPCAALSGEVVSDVRDVLLQPFLTDKYDNLKTILIERLGLTTPERVNKVISGEKLGSDIPCRFLRRLQKTAGFETKAVVGKTVIRQAFIRQMPTSVRAHLVIQPDSASVGSCRTASFPYLGDGCTQLQPDGFGTFSRTSGVTLGDYGRAVVRSR